MKFFLLVEGYTEKVLPAFLKRWLDPRLSQPVGVQAVRFTGWAELVKSAPSLTRRSLSQYQDIIAVVALLDLYGPNFYPAHLNIAAERAVWAKAWMEKQVDHPRFRQHFAVHEVEAWLLSDPNIFPLLIRQALPNRVGMPETVNFDEPPKRLLERLYAAKLRRDFKPAIEGVKLFAKLNPEITYNKCPHLRAMLDEMLALAQAHQP